MRQHLLADVAFEAMTDLGPTEENSELIVDTFRALFESIGSLFSGSDDHRQWLSQTASDISGMQLAVETALHSQTGLVDTLS